MSKITCLDSSTINKIAAGEVIERPSAVVKELVENSIDSGAKAITIEVKDGGTSLIRITDNGCGIEKEEISLAFMRHATSKIRNADDLLKVVSLGFRGEALASVASIAQVEVITKTPEELTGIRYRIEGGEEKGTEEIGCPDGTTFLVRNLFYNVPARKKFLKSNTTETGYVNDLVERLAVSHPNIAFKFISNNQTKLHTSGNGNMKDILYAIYGREISKELLPIQMQDGIIRMSGFVGKPVISRGTRNLMNYFVNGRYVKNSMIHKAIEEAYKPYSMTHRYPLTSLMIDIAPEWIDVNVHPTKMEVRFHDGQVVYELIYHALKEALGHKEFIPEVAIGNDKTEKTEKIEEKIPEPFEKNRMEQYNNQLGKNFNTVREDYGGLKKFSSFKRERVFQNEAAGMSQSEEDLFAGSVNDAPEEPAFGNSAAKEKLDIEMLVSNQEKVITPQEKPEQLTLFEGHLLSQDNRSRHRIIGQLFKTYWIVEFDEKMYLIDQHAAHEKVLYERNMEALRNKEGLSQMVNPPLVITLSMQEEAILNKYKERFTKLGFEIEPFGGKEYAIYGVPADLLGLAEEDIFLDLLDSLAEEKIEAEPDRILEKVASMSCKAAVKGNNALSFAEAEKLIDELLTLENPYHCPHGRPVIISMSKYEIEKKFKRIV